MSPIQAMERSYLALRTMLRQGELPPGARLDANRLSMEFGVSMTPVRDALHRLVGERMVEGGAGEGFHVPKQTESDLRDLYEWHSALVVIAVRTSPPADNRLPADIDRDVGQADLTAMMFDRITAGSPNRELQLAVASAADRLHPFRICEQSVLQPILGELEELGLTGSGQLAAIRRYHLRRIKSVPALLRSREAS